MGANAFFVAIEFALLAVNRSHLDRRVAEGSRPAKVVQNLHTHLSHHLSGAQLGITISSLLVGFLVGQMADGVAAWFALFGATLVQMVFGELIPKSVAIGRPYPTALALGTPMHVYSVAFGPVISFLNWAANACVRLLGVEPREELQSVRSLSEISRLVRASAEQGAIDQRSTGLLTRSFRFSQKTADDILVPRTALDSLESTDTATDLIRLANASGHSRFPVWREDIDDIVGVVHVRRVHAIPPDQRSSTPVSDLMDDAFVVPETRDIDDLLLDLQVTRTQIAVVVDEYGGTAGIITLEDIVEEIVGEIDDEYDDELPLLVDTSASLGPWTLPGTLHPDEVHDICGLQLPIDEGEYETLAGFVLHELGFIPESAGDSVAFQDWRLDVVSMDRRRVAQVLVSRIDLDLEHSAESAS